MYAAFSETWTGSWLLWIVLSKPFAIYIACTIVFVEYTIQKQKIMKPKDKADEDRDAQYSAFRKPDMFLDESIFARLILYAMTPIIPIRFAFGFGINIWCT